MVAARRQPRAAPEHALYRLDTLERATESSEFAEAMSTLASGVVVVTSRRRRPAVGNDRHRVRVGIRGAADGARLPRRRNGQRPRDRSDRRASAPASSPAPRCASRRTQLRPGRTKFLDDLIEPARSRQPEPCDREGSRALSTAISSRLVEAADHIVFFGRVRRARRRIGGEPLLYHSRGYGSFFAPEPTTERNLRCLFELTAKTEPGRATRRTRRALADENRPAVPPKHDREASFPHESLAAIKRSGYLVAPIPARARRPRRWICSMTSLVASSRLARGDAALTLGVNMHLVFLVNVVRLRQVATASGRRAARRRVRRRPSSRIARDGTVFASAVSEPEQDLTRPATTATRTETGWTISGRKIFCTMSPAADVLYTAVTYTEDGRRERYGYAMVPRDTPGVVVHDDWDAMGMRASGSHSVSFEDVRFPASALRGGFSTGDATGYFERNLSAGLFHAAAAIGIAESAHTTAVSRLAVGTGLEPHTQMLVAENIVDLSRAAQSSRAPHR